MASSALICLFLSAFAFTKVTILFQTPCHTKRLCVNILKIKAEIYSMTLSRTQPLFLSDEFINITFDQLKVTTRIIYRLDQLKLTALELFIKHNDSSTDWGRSKNFFCHIYGIFTIIGRKVPVFKS